MFESDIFTYLESLSESKRLEIYGNPLQGDDGVSSELFHIQPALPASSSDGTPNALPQLLYLSYKNHAQFLLDRLIHQISLKSNGTTHQEVLPADLQPEVLMTALDSIDLFAEALERDDSDSDLWRRTSRIGSLVGSQRIARFCLEAVTQAGGLGTHIVSESNGLEANFAAADLKDLITLIQDRLSKTQIPELFQKRKQIPSTLRRIMDICPGLPEAARAVDLAILPPSTTVEILVSLRTWAYVGKVILQQHRTELQGSEDTGFGTNYVLVLPNENDPLAGPSKEHGETAKAPPMEGTNARLSSPPSTSEAQNQSYCDEDAKTTNEGVQVLSTYPSLVDLANDGTAWKGATVYDTLHTEAQSRDSYHQLEPPEVGGIISGFETHDPPVPTSVLISLPTRKRTLESAGLPEAGDSGRVRSKRIRARVETAVDEENEAAELARFYEDRLRDYHRADHWLSSIIGDILSKVGFQEFNLLEDVRSTLSSTMLESSSHPQNKGISMHTAWRDLEASVLTWDLIKSHILLQRNTVEDSNLGSYGSSDSTFAKFLEYSKVGLPRPSSRQALSVDFDILDFVTTINSSWTSLEDFSMQWIKSLLQPQEYDLEDKGNTYSTARSKYLDYVWPDSLKETVVQMLVTQDPHIFKTLTSEVDQLDHRVLCGISLNSSQQSHKQDRMQLELIQAIFELHLDIYGSITNPNSMVDNNTRVFQRDRLERWAGLSSRAMAIHRSSNYELSLPETITFRYLWASVVYIHLVESEARDHIILCLRDLKSSLESSGSLIIELQNNAIMPEISSCAADREISKLTTMDFFLGIFEPNKQDPLFVIESLEPILRGLCVGDNVNSTDQSSATAASEDRHSKDCLQERSLRQFPPHFVAPATKQITDFLDKATVSLHLVLWQKLRMAYETIDYPPMIFLCIMQSIQLIFKELRGPLYCNEIPENRTLRLVQWLGNLDDLLIRALRLAMEKVSALDCMDEDNLKISIHACIDLIQLLHVFVLQEDSIRVGYCVAPHQPVGPATSAYKTSMNVLRDMHVKAWILLYLLIKEALSQDQIHRSAMREDLVGYLKTLHHVLGPRGYCELAKKLFLKFAKTELLDLQASEDWEFAVGQIIFDLYGLKVCPNNPTLADHGCTPDPLNRGTVLELVDFVMKQAEKVSVKDLLKTDLKGAIDKMQGVLGAPEPKSLVFNRRVLNAYLKLPINPLDMYRSLRGIGTLSSTLINTEHALIAKKRWYFLLGFTTFAKFRSQKRLSPGPTDDLDVAIIFFRHDLEFDTEKWETWYRLAQVYDAKLEENTTWSADKLNGQMSELITLQRNAIRCYMMAVAVAVRCADSSFETAAKMSDLYTDFANRVYSSSREPFSMAAFDLQDFKRFCNNHRGTYERLPFRQLHVREAWIFASVLYRQALIDKPESWL